MNHLYKKLTGMTLGLAIAASVAIPSVSALTSADIQLLVQLGVIPADKVDAALAIANNTGTTTCGASFTQNMTIGARGAQVIALQNFLESQNFLTMPTGVSKGYFGVLTQQALARYQSSAGIAPAAGFFGPTTMSKVNAACVATPGGSTTTPVVVTTDTKTSDLKGGEANLEKYNVRSTYSNEQIEEGSRAKVFAAKFNVEDGDARLQRVDIRLEGMNQLNEDEPWKQIKDITLYVNGNKVATRNASDKSVWSRETSTELPASSRAYEIRFVNVNERIEESEEVEIEVEITASGNIDNSDLPQQWKVWIPNNGIRAIDGEKIQQYTGSDSQSKHFTIETADDGDVTIREISENQDSQLFIVDSKNKKGSYNVFEFEIKNQQADIYVNKLTLLASTSDDRIEDVVNELQVVIDGKTYSSDAYSKDGGVGIFTFDFEDNDEEILIKKDEIVKVVSKATFNKFTNNFAEGTTVQFGIGKINGASYGDVGIEAEGKNSGKNSDVGGRQESKIHTLRSEGVNAGTTGQATATLKKANFAGDTEQGTYEIDIKLSALEADMYIPNSVGTTTEATAGFVYRITNAGVPFEGDVIAFVSDNNARTETNDRLKISEGSSVSFKILVRLDPTGVASGNAFGVELQQVRFSSTPIGDLATYIVPNEARYETKRIVIK